MVGGESQERLSLLPISVPDLPQSGKCGPIDTKLPNCKPSLFRAVTLVTPDPTRHHNHARMAADTSIHSDKSTMTAAEQVLAELVAFTKEELDSDAERQAKLQAASAGALPRESQTGATLDLSNRKIRALPVEIIGLIKDKVERYTCC